MKKYIYCIVPVLLLMTIITTSSIGQTMETPKFFTDKNRYISFLPPKDWDFHQPTTNDPRTKLILSYADKATGLPVSLTIIVYQVEEPRSKESMTSALVSKLELLRPRGATYSEIKDVNVAQTDCIQTEIMMGDAKSLLILGYPDGTLCLDIVYHAPKKIYDRYLDKALGAIESLVTLKGALNDDPELIKQQRLIWLKKQVYIYIDEKDYETARSMLKEIIKEEPEDFSMYFLFGMTYMEQENYEAAQPYFGQAIEMFPAYWEAYFKSGVAAMHTQDYETAINQFNKAIEINPEATEVQVDLGIAYRKLGEPEKSIQVYEKLLALDPSNQIYLFNIGRTYSDMGSFEKAKQAYEKCLDSNPYFVRAIVNLAYLYVSIADFPKARELCERALSYDSTLEEAKTLLNELNQVEEE